MIHIVVKLWQYDNPIVIWLNYQVHHKTNCVLSINKIKNQRGDIETDTKEIQRFITGCHEQWYPKQSVQTRRKG